MAKVEEYLQKLIREEGCIHMTLLDPEKKSGYDCASIAKQAEAGGSAAIMVGGSTVASGVEMEDAVKRIKAVVKLPVIIFPKNHLHTLLESQSPIPCQLPPVPHSPPRFSISGVPC